LLRIRFWLHTAASADDPRTELGRGTEAPRAHEIETGNDLWVMPMTGGRKPWVFLRTPFREGWGAFSPDGRWVAYQSDESGRNDIYVRPFVTPAATGTPTGAAGGQRQVSTAGGIMPVWRPDGKELYYLNPAGAMMAAPITLLQNWHPAAKK
jgi:Tol biopolymer transport system component